MNLNRIREKINLSIRKRRRGGRRMIEDGEEMREKEEREVDGAGSREAAKK